MTEPLHFFAKLGFFYW